MTTFMWLIGPGVIGVIAAWVAGRGGPAGDPIAWFIGAAIVLLLVHAFTRRRDGQRMWS